MEQKMTEAFKAGFIDKCAEHGIDGRTFIKLAAGRMSPAQYRKFVADEEAADDAYWEDRQKQLERAGATSGNFSGGVLRNSGTGANASVGRPPAGKSDSPGGGYSGFNAWYANNRDAFRGAFTDANGNFSDVDYNRFRNKYPRFFTGSDALRNSMFTTMTSHVGRFGGPYTVSD